MVTNNSDNRDWGFADRAGKAKALETGVRQGDRRDDSDFGDGRLVDHGSRCFRPVSDRDETSFRTGRLGSVAECSEGSDPVCRVPDIPCGRLCNGRIGVSGRHHPDFLPPRENFRIRSDLVYGNDHPGDHDGRGDSAGGGERLYCERTFAGYSHRDDFQRGFRLSHRIRDMPSTAHDLPGVDALPPLGS